MKNKILLFTLLFVLFVSNYQVFSQGLPQLIGNVPDPAEVLGEDGQIYQKNWQFNETSYDTYIYNRPENEDEFVEKYIHLAENERYRVEKVDTEGFPSLRISVPLMDDAALLLYNYQGYMLLMVPENISFVLKSETYVNTETPENTYHDDNIEFLMDPDEANQLGNRYANGDGIKQSFSEAVKYYRIAAEQGDPEGQCNLAVSYYRGQGVMLDDEEALKWFQLAADQGYARGQYNVGVYYDRGIVVEQDYREAMKWYLLAAEQNYAMAQYNIAILFYYGKGVDLDYKEAMKWYLLAAENNIAEAQHNIGYMYHMGIGVKQDYSEALKWYTLAAEQGHAESQNNLGYLYELGLGTIQNYIEAEKWYRKASEQGNTSAATNLRRISPLLTWNATPIPKSYTGFGYIEQKGDVGTLLRDKPSTSGGIMRSVLNGNQIKLLNQSRKVDGIIWVFIETKEGQQGWIQESAIKRQNE